MYFVGIDIAKKFHIACVLDEKDTLVKKNYRIESDSLCFEQFTQLLNDIDSDKSKFLIGMEATGTLFENLYITLKNIGYNVVLLNPYQTSRFREMDTMKYVKNDNIDSQMIGHLLKVADTPKVMLAKSYINLSSLYIDTRLH